MNKFSAAIFILAAFTTTAAAQGTLPCEAPAAAGSGVAFHVPLEAGDGLIAGRKGSTPFTASLRLHPSIGIFNDALRIGPSGGVFYENPGWLGLLGGRISCRLWKSDLLPGATIMSLHVAGEALARLDSGRKTQIGGAVTLNLGELIALSFRGARDLFRNETSLELSISSDIASWFPKEEHVPADMTHRTSTLQTLYEVLATDVTSRYTFTFANNASIAAMIRAQLTNGSSLLMTAGTITAMKAALDNAGLHDLTVQVDMLISGAKNGTQMQLNHTGVLPNPIHERALVRSFIDGWCKALQPAH